MSTNLAFHRKYGPWAVVTGASSGIGEEFARQLALRGLNVVLVARRLDRLIKLGEQLLREHGVQTLAIEADLSEPDAIARITEQTQALDVGLLVNSAGFAMTGAFLEQDLRDQLKLMDVDCRAPMALSHFFGLRFVQRKAGGIVNVASASAFLPMPHWANYSAAKIYLVQLSEALWYELRPQGVDVLALCPGNTHTEFASVSGSGMQGGMKVQPVVALALRHLGHKPLVVAGWGNALASLIPRFISRRASIVLGAKIMGQ